MEDAPLSVDPSTAVLTEADLLKVQDIMGGRLESFKLTRHYGGYADFPLGGQLDCIWLIDRETAGFAVKGSVKGTMQLECARCLESYALPLSLPVDEHYVLASYVQDEREKELQPEDYYETIGEHDSLDLRDLAHQLLVLEAEDHPTCTRPTCTLPGTKSETP